MAGERRGGLGEVAESIWAQLKSVIDGKLDDDLQARLDALPNKQNEYGYDPFGFNREDAKTAMLLARFLYRDYFRAQSFGIEKVPSGRVLVIGNHSGQLPFDAVCVAAALLLDGNPPRVVRSMIERFTQTMPFVSYLFARWGQITGTPENCRRLLNSDEAILVFPEGVRGITKPFTQRYQLQDFGLGFMRLALETKSPIVPVAIIGAEEQAPAINVTPLAKLLGLPSFPIMPVPPFLPIVPLPTRYRLHFGDPMTFTGDPDDEDEVLEEKVRRVKSEIQNMLRIGLKERKHVFW